MNINLLMRANALILGLVRMLTVFFTSGISEYHVFAERPYHYTTTGRFVFGVYPPQLDEQKQNPWRHLRPSYSHGQFYPLPDRGMALTKYVLKGTNSNVLLIITSVYVIFGMAFTHPRIKEPNDLTGLDDQ